MKQTSPNNWTEQMTFPGIMEFVICNGNDLTTNSCSLTPSLNTVTMGIGRLIRFRVTGQYNQGPTPGERLGRLTYQSAFFSRNPVLGNPTLVYTN